MSGPTHIHIDCCVVNPQSLVDLVQEPIKETLLQKRWKNKAGDTPFLLAATAGNIQYV